MSAISTKNDIGPASAEHMPTATDSVRSKGGPGSLCCPMDKGVLFLLPRDGCGKVGSRGVRREFWAQLVPKA